MAQSKSKSEASAELAYADAAATVPVKKPAKAAAPKPGAARKAAPAKAASAKADPVAAIETPAAEPVATVAAPVPEVVVAVADTPLFEVAATAPEPTVSKTPLIELKDIIMTTDFTTNVTETMTEAATEVQARFQQAFDKSSATLTEMTDLAKGNVEAVVESGKVFAAGVQGFGKSMADEAKGAYETATADMKEMAAIKSPTELFQLQGKIMRRNFDLFVAATSKNTDAALKLANEAMAPISGRVNLAAEKLTKIAA